MPSQKNSATNTEIYLDHAASSHLDPEAAKLLQELYANPLGNAASLHGSGVRASMLVEKARQAVATRLGAKSEEIYFSSGGTESNNLALLGAAGFPNLKGKRILISTIEHPSVREPAKFLEKHGAELVRVPVDKDARLDLVALEKALKGGAALVSVMHANNETGTLQNISAIGALCRKYGALYHCDASQSFCKSEINVEKDSIDLLTLSAHKFHGPRGIGALYVRQGLAIHTVYNGGGQERGMRPGTVAVELIAGLHCAMDNFTKEESARLLKLSERFKRVLGSEIPGCSFHGCQKNRVATILNIKTQRDAKGLLLDLSKKGIAVSAGSACSSGKKIPSPVLLAMGMSESESYFGLRVSLGRETTEKDIEAFVEALKDLHGNH
jgi:cysteine desulfurase